MSFLLTQREKGTQSQDDAIANALVQSYLDHLVGYGYVVHGGSQGLMIRVARVKHTRDIK